MGGPIERTLQKPIRPATFSKSDSHEFRLLRFTHPNCIHFHRPRIAHTHYTNSHERKNEKKNESKCQLSITTIERSHKKEYLVLAPLPNQKLSKKKKKIRIKKLNGKKFSITNFALIFDLQRTNLCAESIGPRTR